MKAKPVRCDFPLKKKKKKDENGGVCWKGCAIVFRRRKVFRGKCGEITVSRKEWKKERKENGGKRKAQKG